MAANFADLRPRLISAAVMAVIGATALWAGGMVFATLVLVVTLLMAWELYRLTLPEAPFGPAEAHGAVAAILVATFTFTWGGWIAIGALCLAAVLLALRLPKGGRMRRDRRIFGGYLALILLAGHGLIDLRDSLGAAWVLWLIAVVIASDVAGYFAGRILGGPKFWPAVSPKKTWSGTVAGWVLAGIVGWIFAGPLGVGAGLIVVSVILSFAGQMGDIVESAMKRRKGVKDSSALIPGHGGVLDRFDALIAVVALDLLLIRTGLLGWVTG